MRSVGVGVGRGMTVGCRALALLISCTWKLLACLSGPPLLDTGQLNVIIYLFIFILLIIIVQLLDLCLLSVMDLGSVVLVVVTSSFQHLFAFVLPISSILLGDPVEKMSFFK